MVNKKKVLIISPKAFGYIDYLYQEVKKYNEFEVNVIYIEVTGYNNLGEKIKNFFSKLFLRRNLKKEHYFLRKEVKKMGMQDEVLIIRPDFLNNSFLSLIKKHTKKFTAFYFDSAIRIKRKQEIVGFFDKIYSFDTRDVKEFGFEFLTNYIFEEREINTSPEYLFFNISSNDDDYRFYQLENFGKYLNNNNWSHKLLSFHPVLKYADRGVVEVIDEIMDVKQVINLIEKSKILVEFQRNNQIGLSFRIFESLGLKKKLITNNKDVVNYDFYDPQNILVIDENNIEIPKEFVESPYKEIDSAIVNQYRLENWVKKVFNL